MRIIHGKGVMDSLEEIVDPQGMRQFGVKLAAEIAASAPTVTLTGTVPDEFRAALAQLAAQHGVEVRG